MKRLVIGGAVAALIAGGAGASFAAGGGSPYPNGNNDYGLCTAYAAHDAHNPNGQPGPFAAMQAAYDQANGDGAWAKFCQSTLAGTGAPGNSEHGGH